MSIVCADSSALARVYLADEPGWQELEAALLDSQSSVATSELSALELAGAAKGAERAGRIESAHALLSVIDADLDSRITLVRLKAEHIIPEARKLVLTHRLRAPDAIHLAVALDLCDHEAGGVVFVTRDADQDAAARALGFNLASSGARPGVDRRGPQY